MQRQQYKQTAQNNASVSCCTTSNSRSLLDRGIISPEVLVDQEEGVVGDEIGDGVLWLTVNDKKL